MPLNFSSGNVTTTGTLTGAASNKATSCISSSGPDVVYSFQATAGQVLTATLLPSGNWRPILTLFGGSSCSGSPEATCHLAPSNGANATITSAPLTTGTWYLWVDSPSGSMPGDFTLTASLLSSAPDAGTSPDGGVLPNGEACASAIPLTLTTGFNSFNGTLAGASDDQEPTCTSSGADRVYAITVSEGQVLSAAVSTAGNWKPALSLRSGTTCTSATELRCFASPVVAGTAALVSDPLPAGTHYLWVDAEAGSSPGDFSLDLHLGSQPNAETCATAFPLTRTAAGGGVIPVMSSTVGKMNNTSAACLSPSGPELMYALTLGTNENVNITITPEAGYAPVLLLWGPNASCSSLGSERACLASTPGSTFSLSRTNLPAGNYLIGVESQSSQGGSFTLYVGLTGGSGTTGGIGGDTCSAPERLIFADGLAVARGTTAMHFGNQFVSSVCSTSSPDRVYAFSLSTSRFVRAWLVPEAGYQGAIVLTSGSDCSAASATQCHTVAPGAVSDVGAFLSAGSYFLWVDGYGATNSGQYTLIVSQE